MPIDFTTLAQQCAPSVHPTTLQAVVKTESSFNPFAIGVVGGRLARAPRSEAEAVATVNALEAGGWNYSMGLAQVNRANLKATGLTPSTVFDPCANLKAGSAILSDCYTRARPGRDPQAAIQAALSCYYSGNFSRGFQREADGRSYVMRVVANAAQAPNTPPPVVPAVQPIAVTPDPGSPVRVKRSESAGKPASRSTADQPHPAWDALGDF
ncbi:lytic transglycosylase domain-containing protein [Burkholderia alba]|uniref:lytic transglycosylase domain-containing protein n=1 Tax=Burkholderia alba TaxID=2683677 RepID=UPI002B059D6E|nr:lytic transglycosylase domain-containing protein [Burkholderia alba]